MAEGVWIESVLKKIGVHQPKLPILWFDNLGATYLSTNLVFPARSKHSEVDFHFVREKVALGVLDVQFVLSGEQLAVVFAKPVCFRFLVIFVQS
jgi:hypothetical protein